MRTLDNELIEILCKDYRKHGSLRTVARLHHCSPNTVKKYASQQMNVKTQQRVSALQSSDARLIGTYVGLWLGDGTQYYDEGYTVKICSNKENKLLNDFIRQIIHSLFGKFPSLNEEKTTKRAHIKCSSKFIFEFIHHYVCFEKGYKTCTVHLRNTPADYDVNFLEGCLLGLALSDGYLKERFLFNVVSPLLSENTSDILMRFGFHPVTYIHKRERYGWKDLHMVRLTRQESGLLKNLFDLTLKNLGVSTSFDKLKNGPAEI